jgi:ADP-ribose pyrophosphatase YjhB (NUDIX family)
MHRIGIVPFDSRGDAVALLFVTSQTRGRWILPKGNPKKNETQEDVCHREGFEEAGVRGIVLSDFPMTSVIGRQTDKGIEKIPVTYYPMLVQEQADTWPEVEKRERHWTLMNDAKKVVYRDDLRAVLNNFEELLPWIKKASEHYISQQPEAQKLAP